MNPLHAVDLFQTARAGIGLLGATRTFAAAPSVQTAFHVGGQLVGVIGTENVLRAFVKVAAKVVAGSVESDRSTANEMVDMMRARVPHRSGRLLNGIEQFESDGVQIVAASAINPTGRKGGTREGADYAPFVEHGTKPGQRGERVATADFFNDSTGAGSRRKGRLNPETGRRFRVDRRAARRQYRTHPGTEAQPFFWNSAREAFARRGQKLEDVIASQSGEME